MRTLFGIVVFIASAPGQQLPSWLSPYPGSNEAPRATTASTTEISYTATATTDEVVAHYRKTLDAATAPYVAAFDGAGTSIRASAAECDLLIRIRDTGERSSAVRVSCSAKKTPLTTPAGVAASQPVAGFGGSNAAPPIVSSSTAARSAGASTDARIEAQRQRSRDRMKEYDKPNYEHVRKKPKHPIW